MKPIETLVLTRDEIKSRPHIVVPNPDNRAYIAVALAAGKLVAYALFDDNIKAIGWTLDKSVWTYN